MNLPVVMEIILMNWIVKVKVGMKDPFITTLVVQGKNEVMLLFDDLL